MKKIFYLFMTTLALVTISCDNNFEEINVSPDLPTETDPNLLLSFSMLNCQNTIYDMFAGGDMGGVWSQQWSKGQYNDEELYVPRTTAFNNFWDVMYVNCISEASSCYTLAGAEGNTNLQGAALVVKANAFQVLTDAFGPIPFSEAGVSGNTKPVHDSQENVYNGIIALLDEAETLFASGSGTITPASDLIYGGDVTKWRKLAMSLKLKALMRISKVRNVSTEVQNVLASGLLFSSNTDSANLTYNATQPDANPTYETVVFGNRTEYRVSSILVNKLNSLSDPRLPVFAQLNNSGVYVGNTPGTTTSSVASFSAIGTKYLQATAPGVVLSYAQVEMYLAEAYNEGIIPGTLTDAKTHYVNAINANFEFNGLVPSTAYTSSAVVDFTTQVEAREKIATQMWLLLYGQGIEAWTEWRRTGYPALSPVLNAAITAIPKRFLFASHTQSYNNANYQAASATLNNGDSMLSKVWWMN